MMQLSNDVLKALSGKSLASAESITGGGIGAAITDIPGASDVYRGGVICYTNAVKIRMLGVSAAVLATQGAICGEVASQMATGVRALIGTDVAISVTGLAGPGGDEFGNPVGTIYIGYADESSVDVRKFLFIGDRDRVRQQTVAAALQLILEHNP